MSQPGEVTHGTEEIGPVSNDEPDEEVHSPPDSLPT